MPASVAGDREYRRTVNAWCLYDWGNSAFATTIMAGVFPLFYRSMATSAGLGEADATAAWAYTTSIALLIVAVIGPPLGSFCDQVESKKRFLAFFAGLGVCASALFVLLGDDSYLTGSVLFIAGNIGFAAGNIFYESLLPHVARPGDLDRVSTRGYAMGYVGGGILLTFNLLWVMHPGWFLLPGTGFALRLSFFSVAVWWAVFTIPLLRRVEEPRLTQAAPGAGNVMAAAFGRLASTFRQVRRHRQLLLFLAAFWLYNDGIGTIIKMAIAYGDEVGIGRNDLITALVLTQFVGIPCTFLFGRLAKILGTKRSILAGLGVYGLISVAGYSMQTSLHFYILAGLVGMVQGGTQALSRSLYASMVPRARSAEFFGFYSTSSRFAGIFGPLVFGVVSQLTGGSRLGIVSLIFFFIAGGGPAASGRRAGRGPRRPAGGGDGLRVRRGGSQGDRCPGVGGASWRGSPPARKRFTGYALRVLGKCRCRQPRGPAGAAEVRHALRQAVRLPVQLTVRWKSRPGCPRPWRFQSGSTLTRAPDNHPASSGVLREVRTTRGSGFPSRITPPADSPPSGRPGTGRTPRSTAAVPPARSSAGNAAHRYGQPPSRWCGSSHERHPRTREP